MSKFSGLGNFFSAPVVAGTMALCLSSGQIQQAQAVAPGETKVGVAAAVGTITSGQAPSAAPRVLQVGVDIVADEKVVTDENGRTQLLFLDGSALTIGPNSEVTIDKFAYDPTTETGELAFAATKGLFRLVGGKLSKKNPVILRTKAAVIGIRGGIAIVNVATDGAVEANFEYGHQMTVQSGGVTKSARRPGSYIAVAPGGAAPSEAAVGDGTNVAKAMGGLEGSSDGGGDEGGVSVGDADVANSGVSGVSSSYAPAAVAPRAPGQSLAPPPPPANSVGKADGSAEINKASQDVINDGALDEAIADGTVQIVDGVPLAPGAFLGRYIHSSSRISGADFGSSGLDIQLNTITNDSGDLVTGADNGNIRLPLPGTPGPFSFGGAGTSSPFGELVGTGFLTDDRQFVFYQADEIDFPGDRVLLFAGVPTTLFPTSGITTYDFQFDNLIDSNLPFIRGDIGGNLPPGPFATAAIVWSGPTPVILAINSKIVGQGPGQEAALSFMLGEVGTNSSGKRGIRANFFGFPDDSDPNIDSLEAGLSGGDFAFPVRSTEVSSGDSFFGPNAGAFVLDASVDGGVGAFDDQFNPLFSYNPAAVAILNAQRAGQLNSKTRTTQVLKGFVAGGVQEFIGGSPVGASGFTSSPFAGFGTATLDHVQIGTNASTNRVTTRFIANNANIGSSGLTIDVGLGAEEFAGEVESVFVVDGLFGAIGNDTGSTVDGVPVFNDTLMFTANTSDFSSALPAGVTPCTCEYLSWGFWVGDTFDSGGLEHEIDAFWVAGMPANAAQIAGLVGSASYAGHASIVVQNGANDYIAFGNFDMGYDFATRTGSANITKLDGADFLGIPIAGVSGQENFFNGTPVSDANSLSRTIELQGAFFQKGTDPAGHVAGQVAVFGPSYAGLGTVAGDKVTAPQ